MSTHSLRSQGRTLLVFLAIVLLASPALAQTSRITGTVQDAEGNPVPDATITATKPGASTRQELVRTTDSAGRWSVLGMEIGAWTLTVEAEGFQTNVGQAQVRLTRNRTYDFSMERLKHPLELALGDAAVEGMDFEALQAEFDAADSAYNGRQWDQAVTGYRSILSKVPMMNSLHLQLGSALRQLEQYEEAIASFELALAGDAGLESEVEVEIARTRMAMGDFEAAGSALASAASGENASREDLYNLGELEFVRGEIDAAAAWYEKSHAVDPNWGKPLFKLALVALNKGDIETAKTLFSQVLERDPNSEEGAQAQATLDALP